MVGDGRHASFRQALESWLDPDLAAYELAIAIGLMDPQRDKFATNAKHVFWSANPVGESLHRMLLSLVDAGVLQVNEEAQFRWNQQFVGTWEVSR